MSRRASQDDIWHAIALELEVFDRAHRGPRRSLGADPASGSDRWPRRR